MWASWCKSRILLQFLQHLRALHACVRERGFLLTLVPSTLLHSARTGSLIQYVHICRFESVLKMRVPMSVQACMHVSVPASSVRQRVPRMEPESCYP